MTYRSSMIVLTALLGLSLVWVGPAVAQPPIKEQQEEVDPFTPATAQPLAKIKFQSGLSPSQPVDITLKKAVPGFQALRVSGTVVWEGPGYIVVRERPGVAPVKVDYSNIESWAKKTKVPDEKSKTIFANYSPRGQQKLLYPPEISKITIKTGPYTYVKYSTSVLSSQEKKLLTDLEQAQNAMANAQKRLDQATQAMSAAQNAGIEKAQALNSYYRTVTAVGANPQFFDIPQRQFGPVYGTPFGGFRTFRSTIYSPYRGAISTPLTGAISQPFVVPHPTSGESLGASAEDVRKQSLIELKAARDNMQQAEKEYGAISQHLLYSGSGELMAINTWDKR
ncbi:MAG: hypothetical protein ACFCD0_20785 [Gemmataceae bacterium]